MERVRVTPEEIQQWAKDQIVLRGLIIERVGTPTVTLLQAITAAKTVSYLTYATYVHQQPSESPVHPRNGLSTYTEFDTESDKKLQREIDNILTSWLGIEPLWAYSQPIIVCHRIENLSGSTEVSPSQLWLMLHYMRFLTQIETAIAEYAPRKSLLETLHHRLASLVRDCGKHWHTTTGIFFPRQ